MTSASSKRGCAKSSAKGADRRVEELGDIRIGRRGQHRAEPRLVFQNPAGSDFVFVRSAGYGHGVTYQYGSENCPSPGLKPAPIVRPPPRWMSVARSK